jgi:hypothetical protein
MYLAHPRSRVFNVTSMQNSCIGLTFAAMTTTPSVPERVVRTPGATSKGPKEKRITSFAADNARLRQRHATNQPTASKIQVVDNVTATRQCMCLHLHSTPPQSSPASPHFVPFTRAFRRAPADTSRSERRIIRTRGDQPAWWFHTPIS